MSLAESRRAETRWVGTRAPEGRPAGRAGRRRPRRCRLSGGDYWRARAARASGGRSTCQRRGVGRWWSRPIAIRTAGACPQSWSRTVFFRPSHIAPTQEARVLPTINLSCLQTAGAPRWRPSRVTPRTAPVNFHGAGAGGRRRPRSGGTSVVNVHCVSDKKNTEFISLLERDTHLFFLPHVALHRQYGDVL